MAGIGWRLERLIHRGVAGAAAAYATGAAVMALPWVLTTAVLVTLPLAIGRHMANFTTARSTVNGAYAVALLVVGPMQIVLSRYAADRMYEGRMRAIAAPFCRGLAATLVICAAIGGATLAALHLEVPAVLWGAALAAAVGTQWTALAVGNGLCRPGFVLGAVGAGAVLSFVLAALLAAAPALGVSGYLFGLIAGQSLTLVILLIGIFHALPEQADEGARLLPAFRDFAPLAGAGFAFNASLWADKLIAFWLVGGRASELHSAASTVAWFSTIPCLAWTFVEVETTFHRRFRRFYRTLEGGASLAALRHGNQTLENEAGRLLRGAACVQLCVTAFLELAAAPAARWLGLPHEAILPYRLLLIAAGAQALGLLGLILLYYFDLRGEALTAATGLLVGITAFTTAASLFGFLPSVGTLVGCALGATLIWYRVFAGVSTVLQHTLLGQPYVVKARAEPVPAGRGPMRGTPR